MPANEIGIRARLAAVAIAMAASAAPAHAVMPEFYLGINASRASSSIDSWETGSLKKSYGDATFMTGVHAGFDVGVLGLFVGVVGDFSLRPNAFSAWQKAAPSASLEYGLRNKWQATLRARAGVDFGTLRPYLSAGLAASGLSSYRLDKAAGSRLSASETKLGFTGGAGLELAITPALRIHAEYIGFNFPKTKFSASSASWKTKLTDHQLRLGVSFVLNP